MLSRQRAEKLSGRQNWSKRGRAFKLWPSVCTRCTESLSASSSTVAAAADGYNVCVLAARGAVGVNSVGHYRLCCIGLDLAQHSFHAAAPVIGC
jgi:hypothetical protein